MVEVRGALVWYMLLFSSELLKKSLPFASLKLSREDASEE